MTTLRFGGHLKASEGLSFVVSTARGLDYNEVQIMVGDGRDYTPWEIAEEDAEEYRKMMYGITTTVHMPYVINPCEEQGRRRSFYKRSFKAYIEAAQNLGAMRIVLHPGFKKELTEVQAYKNLLKFLAETWESDYRVQLLIETDSGSKNGSAIGSPEFIAEVLANSEIPGLGMCLDTAHMYARGTDLWNKAVREEFLGEFGRLIKYVHLNVPDKEVKLGSFLDRHNTPFIERKDLNSAPLIQALAAYPMVLERRSLMVQQKDNIYVREVLGVPLEKQRA